MNVLVGLGNPGARYEATRHNIGFLVVEEIRRRHGAPAEEKRPRMNIARVAGTGYEMLLIRPLTYMNASGRAVAGLFAQTGAGPQDLLVICDDLHLDLGVVRLRKRGSDGGHNGLRSIIETLGTTEFARLRVGVGPAEPGAEYADFVLAPFPPAARDRLPEIIDLAADCAEMAVSEGIERAMNQFNRRQAAGATDGGGRL